MYFKSPLGDLGAKKSRKRMLPALYKCIGMKVCGYCFEICWVKTLSPWLTVMM